MDLLFQSLSFIAIVKTGNKVIKLKTVAKTKLWVISTNLNQRVINFAFWSKQFNYSSTSMFKMSIGFHSFRKNKLQNISSFFWRYQTCSIECQLFFLHFLLKHFLPATATQCLRRLAIESNRVKKKQKKNLQKAKNFL